MGLCLESYRDIAQSVFRRYLEGNHISHIDKINYYNARKEYYSIKARNSQEFVDFYRFDEKRKACEIELKELECKVAA